MSKLALAIGAAIVVVLAGAAITVAWMQSRPRPTVTAGTFDVLGAQPREVAVTVDAAGAGPRRLSVAVVQAGKSREVLSSTPAPGTQDVVSLDAAQLGLAEGDAELVVHAADDLWRPKQDPSPQLVHRFRVDLTPPTVQFVGGTQHVVHAGSAVAIYRTDGASWSGVQVGEARFPGHAGLSSDPAVHVALYALPYDQPETFPALWAEDEAGNFRTAALPVTFLPAKFRQDRVVLTEKLLRRKVPELDPQTPGDATAQQLLERFLVINGDGRRKSEEVIREAARAETAGRPLFSGRFRQQSNTKVFAGTPQKRTYVMDDAVVDEQWHLGLDLASNQRVPIEAAGAGRVTHVGDNGIYGNMVLIDHGLGLVSLYAHLSETAVRVGDEVAQGAVLGRSGQSGLAAGDHLHFAMLIHGAYVDPIEWWDGAWIRERFAKPLLEAGVAAPGVAEAAGTPAAARR